MQRFLLHDENTEFAYDKIGVWIYIGLITHLAVLTLPVNIQTAPTSPAVASTTYIARPLVVSEENSIIEDVVASYDVLTHHAEWLGLHISDQLSEPPAKAPDTYSYPLSEHMQGHDAPLLADGHTDFLCNA